MDKVKLNQIVVVEGKYDKIKLSSILDAVIIDTEGFGIFKDKDKLNSLRKLAETNGLLIITDSDSAGFKIRNYLLGSIDNSQITNVFIPDIYGKERRKKHFSAEKKLGVEGIPEEDIIKALSNSGILYTDSSVSKDPISLTDFYDDGFVGKENSSDLREKLIKVCNLPSHISTTQLIKYINNLGGRSKYVQLKKLIQ